MGGVGYWFGAPSLILIKEVPGASSQGDNPWFLAEVWLWV